MPTYTVQQRKEEFPWVDQFFIVWCQLAEEGRVDDLGGAEYRRVRSLWVVAGSPGSYREFILRNV